ncbi:copper homeostasis protein CutC [Aureibacter tunicatorum]|uniref:PF03932 family protein CutC n=1 Tax=Aureibacter tunicatorum TaxID=866807 RepID=A0AAE3XMF5_9BACT|nr:copper homeostasis protein CutC [Aureibacter tunicatorum]MDR6238619.1 copper homeostasis protein [Aureibacter tunicatorum]BDD05450.1 copper homeostasis protein CutC [Aureibacter tunicatorum]
MSKKYNLEICIDSVESAINAQNGGAQRVELCANLPLGGTTPTLGLMEVVRKHLEIDVYPIIRPRGGDFLFDAYEVEQMAIDIKHFKERDADGVVIGLLTENAEIDIDGSSKLIEAADGMDITFHRAFDKVIDPFKALDTLKSLGIKRVLSSGLEPTALEGIEMLNKIAEYAKEDISIMPGSGVNASNVHLLAELPFVKELHFSAKNTRKNNMLIQNERVSYSCAGVDENYISYSDEQKVKEVRNILNRLESEAK